MKKALTKNTEKLFYFFSGEKIIGPNPDLSGDCTNLRGNCTGLRGDCSYLSGDCTNLRGDCTDLSGDCSYLRGDCTDLSGDLDKCEITSEERQKGVNVEDLVAKE